MTEWFRHVSKFENFYASTVIRDIYWLSFSELDGYLTNYKFLLLSFINIY